MPLSVEKNAAVRNLLQQTGIDEVTDLQPLVAGCSNENYRVNCSFSLDQGEPQQRLLVLRINNKYTSELCPRQYEVACWRTAQAQNLAPKLLEVAADFSFYISEYIDSPSDGQWPLLMEKPRSESENKRDITQLAQLLSDLHQLAVPNNHMSLSRQWQIYQQQIAMLVTADDYQRVLQLLDEIQSLSPMMRQWIATIDALQLPLSYCHRDLNPNNILRRGDSLMCIDFEYACASNPLFDIAVVIASHGFNEQQSDILWSELAARNPLWHQLTAQQRHAGLQAAINIYGVFSSCWALMMHASWRKQNTKMKLIDYLQWSEESLAQVALATVE